MSKKVELTTLRSPSTGTLAFQIVLSRAAPPLITPNAAVTTEMRTPDPRTRPTSHGAASPSS